MKSQFNVVLFGATGLVGNEVLNRLQAHEDSVINASLARHFLRIL